MGRFVDITGQVYGRLTVISRSENRPDKRNSVAWLCRCECGAAIVVASNSLRRGGTRSCGCFHKETRTSAARKHGHTRNGSWTPEYRAWSGMVERCTNSGQRHYVNYGGRGIKVCDHWLKFENFFADMGKKPSPKHSIDRIDNGGNYEPGNCRWATSIEQMNNMRTNRFVELEGRRMTIADCARALGVHYHALYEVISTADQPIEDNDRRWVIYMGDGRKLNITQYAKELGIPRETLNSRLKKAA